MDSSRDDVLVELTNEDLKELANIYKRHKEDLPHLHSFFQFCLKSKEIGMTDFVKVYSPNKSWREDGTFIASMPAYGHDIVMHSLDPSGKDLIESFRKTKRFTYSYDPAREFNLIYALHEQFAEPLKKVLDEVENYTNMFTDILNLWCLKREKAIKFDIKSPCDIYVKEIVQLDIPTILSVWPYTYPGAKGKFLDCLKLGKGYGVFLKSNNQLVSWVMISPLGQLTALQTLDEYKKKGYGSLAVKAMSKQLAKDGFDVCGTVHIGNTASEALFEKLGFEKIYKVYFCGISNKD